ncbi:hypothetical protein C5O19_03760 [Siphonobacter curvatus]|uniref:Uncharacterized protein n=1 Tax=Siphonobacter curvatus TaxID=2094562 RepID=A0A2S7IMD9_9BACT|nr:hypothetical protein C5O19_03760 [Siphonobacter curvatus]
MLKVAMLYLDDDDLRYICLFIYRELGRVGMSERFCKPSGALGPPGRHSLPTFTSVADATNNASCLLYWIAVNKLEMEGGRF